MKRERERGERHAGLESGSTPSLFCTIYGVRVAFFFLLHSSRFVVTF